MAYTVISQNNTTTTLADELGNVIHVPARVTLATSTEYTITKVNNSTATLEDGDGNILRDVPCVVVLAGGGSTDTHNKGYYATQAALEEAYPTAEAGDWAIVGETDTVWVWDSDNSAWVDTDSKAEVTPDMIIVKSATMPTASTVPAGAVYQYTGATGVTYTHGYIYENKATTSYTDSVEFNPASISGTTVTATTGALASLCEEYGFGNITDIIKGTLTYDQSGDLLVFVGLDDTDTQVCTFQLYTQDYVDAGFTFTGTLADGDVINLTCTISEVVSYGWERIDVQPAPSELPDQTGYSGRVLGTDGFVAGWVEPEIVQRSTIPVASQDEEGNIYQFVGTTDANYTNGYFYKCVSDGLNPATYSWVQTNVQPQGSSLPSQTGNSGKFLTTDGTDASWSDKPLVNTATSGITILGTAATANAAMNIGYGTSANDEGVAIGYQATANSGGTAYGYKSRVGSRAIGIGHTAQGTGNYSTAIGTFSTKSGGQQSVAIGYAAQTDNSATSAIQIGAGTNSTANTFQVWGWRLLDGTTGVIPADRLPNAINKYSSMPTAASTNEGWIVQYTGTTDSTYTHGYIYECVSDGGNPATYSWSAINVQAGGGGGSTATTGSLVAANWSSNSQTISVTGVTASNNVIVAPAPASQAAYTAAGIICTAQGAGTLEFACTTTPSSAITVNVCIFG